MSTVTLEVLTGPSLHVRRNSSARADTLRRAPELHHLLLSLMLQQRHSQLQLLQHRCWA